MSTEQKSVGDERRKLTAEEIGKLQVKTNEIVKRIEKGVISYENALEVMQSVIIEGRSASHLDVVSGKALITYPEFLIDCDAQPFIPEGCKIYEHRKSGQIQFDSKKISLYRSYEQAIGKTEYCENFYKELGSKRVMNASVLDYLLANPWLMPQKWEQVGMRIHFWGTVYSDKDGRLFVRYLGYLSSKWYWERCYFDTVADHKCFAAISEMVRVDFRI